MSASKEKEDVFIFIAARQATDSVLTKRNRGCGIIFYQGQ